jgi:hypothetical protein
MALYDQIYDAFNNPQQYNNNMMMNPNNNMMNPNMMMSNIKPGAVNHQRREEDGQRSLAQLTRAVFGRLR